MKVTVKRFISSCVECSSCITDRVHMVAHTSASSGGGTLEAGQECSGEGGGGGGIRQLNFFKFDAKSSLSSKLPTAALRPAV